MFRDGVFCPELSTLAGTDIDKKYNLPVHIIYVGEIAGKNELSINISAAGQKVFLSLRVKNKLPAFFDIFIKNITAHVHSTIRIINYIQYLFL